MQPIPGRAPAAEPQEGRHHGTHRQAALVTGSTGGIGRETAQLLAAAGAAGRGHRTRQPSAARPTVKAITENGGAARFVAADLTDPDSLRPLADAAGAVDILVNNAAHLPRRTDRRDQDLGAEFDGDVSAANVRAPFLLTAALAPAMVAKGSGSHRQRQHHGRPHRHARPAGLQRDARPRWNR